MQAQFIFSVIFLISNNIGAQQLGNDPSNNGQGFAYSGSVSTGSDQLQNRNGFYGNQQIPFQNPNNAMPNDLNNVFQQALNTFANINQELQNTMQNQQRTLSSGMGLGAPGGPFMPSGNGLNLGLPSFPGFPLMLGLPYLSGASLIPGLPNFNGQFSAPTASLIPTQLLQSAAAAFPQNSIIPNIFNRINPNQQGNGFGGAYASSQSSSYNPNGAPKISNEPTSSTNDNGNVTTYNAYKP